MSANNVPCITSFRHPWDEPELPSSSEIAQDRMETLDADMLQDALDTAGSFNKFFELVAKLLSCPEKENADRLRALYASVLEDVTTLVEKEWRE